MGVTPISPAKESVKVASNTRNCVSCGRSIAWDANVCQYCGHDFRVQMAPAHQEDHVGTGMKIVVYLLSFFVPFLGFIIGVIFYASGGRDHKHVGKVCVLIALWPVILVLICFLAAGAAWFVFW
jgi:hypothetical protein